MANLEVTNVCNLDCPFCFAQEYIGNAAVEKKQKFISIPDYQSELDFLDRSKIEQVRLIGGEPTLHPEFPLLLELAKNRNKKIMVFSNGLMPARAVESLLSINSNDCVVLINIVASRRNSTISVREQQRRFAVIRTLGDRVVLGHTISTPNFSLGNTISLVNQLGCRKIVRVGLSHPASPKYESAIHPRQYKHIGQRLFEFAREAHQDGVRFELDCGFVPCMFTEEQANLLNSYNTILRWNCSPVLDVHISGTMIMCFPNDGLVNIQLSPDSEAQKARDEMMAKTAIYRHIGIFPECSICDFKRTQICSGGGLEHIKYRFRYTPFQLDVKTG